jgi:hypothetical protein
MTETAEPPVRVRMANVFKSVGYAPHKAQRLVHSSSARHRVVAAGRRVGKSEIGAAELDVEAIRTKFCLSFLEDKGMRREFWIVGPEYTDSEKEFRKHYNALKALDAPFDKPGTYYDPHSGDMQLSMFAGKYLVIGKSAKHPERLVGEGLSGVIMAEAAKQKERTWTKYIRSTLADYQGWSLHTSTPEGRNWFYDLYTRGQDVHDDSWGSWRFGSWRNPHVYPLGATPQGLAMLRHAIDNRIPISKRLREDSKVDPEIIDLMLDLSEETFNQEIAATFTDFAGRVFKAWDEDVHITDQEPSGRGQFWAAVDYGFTDPFVWLLIWEDWEGNIIVVDELYETGLSIDDAARMVRDHNLDLNVQQFFPDPASPSDTLALERHLKIRANRDTGGELNIRLRYIREALKDINTHLPETDPLRHPRLLVHRRCQNLIREMGTYRYPDTVSESATTKRKDVPLHANSHSPEALGRFFRGRYGDPGRTGTFGARVAKSNLSRGGR